MSPLLWIIGLLLLIDIGLQVADNLDLNHLQTKFDRRVKVIDQQSAEIKQDLRSLNDAFARINARAKFQPGTPDAATNPSIGAPR
jgi:hypothetical protein